MSLLLSLDEDKLSEQLPDIFEKYEKYANDAEPLFVLKGQRIELVARNLSQYLAFYSQRANEMKHVVKWLENLKLKLEARYTRNVNSGPRAVPAREAGIYVNGESAIVEMNQLIIEASLIANNLQDIKEAFIQLQWNLSNITKLRVAELHEAIL